MQEFAQISSSFKKRTAYLCYFNEKQNGTQLAYSYI